jgi:hypothetical protein
VFISDFRATILRVEAAKYFNSIAKTGAQVCHNYQA